MAEGIPERLQESIPEDLDRGTERAPLEELPAAEGEEADSNDTPDDTADEEDLGAGDEPDEPEQGGEA